MKRYFIFFFTAAASFTCTAQPILTKSNTAPSIGESYVYSNIGWDGIPGSAGPSQIWDFSGITSIGITTVDFVDPTTTPSGASFPNATVSGDYDSGLQYEHSAVSSSVFERVGVYVSGVPVPYNNSEILLQYPFTYNNTYVDAFAATFTSGGLNLNRAGTVTVTADGYGTLMLPNSTVSNVLRVKVSEDYGDFYSGVEMFHYNSDIYMFYKPGITIPILALTHFEEGTNIADYGNFYDHPSLGIMGNDLNPINIYPNPTNNLVSINWNGKTADRIELYNISGQLIYSSTKSVSFIDFSSYEVGVYFLHIWDADNREIRKITKN